MIEIHIRYTHYTFILFYRHSFSLHYRKLFIDKPNFLRMQSREGTFVNNRKNYLTIIGIACFSAPFSQINIHIAAYLE